MKSCVFFADRHLRHDEEPHWSWVLFTRFLKDFKPDILVDGGDHLDFNYLSSFDKEKLLHLEDKRISRDFEQLNAELAILRKSCGEMKYLQGNHEERIDRAIEKQPVLQHLIELENNIDFKGLEIDYYPLTKQPLKVGKLHFLHGVYTNEHHAKKHLTKYMGNVAYGHIHKFQSYYQGIPLRDDEMGANAIGCLCDKNPAYLRGPGHWQNGFAVIYFDDKGYYNLYPVIMTKKRFMFNGVMYAL